jgi:hypothetical protein
MNGRKSKRTDENDSLLRFLRAVDSALDLLHEVVGRNRFECFGRHVVDFIEEVCAIVFCAAVGEFFHFFFHFSCFCALQLQNNHSVARFLSLSLSLSLSAFFYF